MSCIPFLRALYLPLQISLVVYPQLIVGLLMFRIICLLIDARRSVRLDDYHSFVSRPARAASSTLHTFAVGMGIEKTIRPDGEERLIYVGKALQPLKGLYYEPPRPSTTFPPS